MLWRHDLWGEDFNGSVLPHGYSSSPIAYKNTIIALVGGEGASVVAFDPKSGKVRWKAQDFRNSSEAELLEEVARTVPTVVGTTAYLRDKKKVLALDLGQGRR